MDKDLLRIAREILGLPDTKEDNDFAGYVVWNHTGYPAFWESEFPMLEFVSQLIELRDNPEGILD